MTSGLYNSMTNSKEGEDSDGYLKTLSLGIKTPKLLIGADGSEVDLVSVIDNSAAANATYIGAKAGTGVACTITRAGPFFKLDFTFTAVSITHTDAGGSGSSGSLKIFDFVEGAVMPLCSRSDITLTADNVLDSGTTLSAVYGFGSVAADAGDGALTGTEVNYSAISGALTASAHVCTSTTLLKGAGTAVDGTATAADLYFNESCTAATSVANGTILLNGTYTLIGVFIGDD